MQLIVSKQKIDEIFSTFLVALILFANIAIGSAKYLPVVISISIIGMIYCFILTLRSRSTTAITFSGFPFLWILLFSLEMFLYGYFGSDKEAYSLRFHLFNILYIIMLLIIMYYKRERLIELISKACSLEIIMLSLFIARNEFTSIINVLLYSSNLRVGTTTVGNVNTTAVSYIFLIVPVMYQFFYLKRIKYFPILVIGIIFLFLTGSKKSTIALFLIFAVLEFYSATDINKLAKNMLKFLLVISAILIVCYNVPLLREEIWNRLAKMFENLNNYSSGDQSSTGLRLTFIILAFTKAWDKPIFGHGWNSFSRMYGYSTLYQTGLYSHCNYTEVLFSFGLLGLTLFYWFPILATKRAKRVNNLNIKIFALLYCAILFFIDISTVSCYQSILPFVGFSIAYICATTKNQNVIEDDIYDY